MVENAATFALLAVGVLMVAGLVVGKMARRLPQVILLNITLVVVLVVVELLLHFTIMAPLTDHNRTLFQYDETLGWAFIPNAEEPVIKPEYENRIRINAHGFRDRDYPLEAVSGKVTVGVVGDSFTSNMGVEFEDLFTEEMGRRLESQAMVRNLGVNGYGQVQQLLLMKERLNTHPLDLIVLLLYFRNDFDDNLGRFDWIRLYKRPKATLDHEGNLKLLPPGSAPPKNEANESRTAQRVGFTQRLALCRLINQAYDKMFPKVRPLHKQAPETRYCRKKYAQPETEALNLMRALLAEMKKVASDRGIPFAVVLAPSLWQIDSGTWDTLLDRLDADKSLYDRTMPQNKLARICKELEIPCLDLLPAFENHATTGERLYYPQETHWTDRGNEIAGQTIAEWLDSNSFFLEKQ